MQDLVIIGGGAGGLVVASVAAQLGLKVTLIEKEAKLGGDCLHYGCIPSKTLIKAAKVASLMRRGKEFGLPDFNPKVDLGKVNDHVQDVIDHIQKHDDPDRFRSYGCEVIFGTARFTDKNSIRVNDQTITGKRFVLATGSRPMIPPIPGLAESGYLTNIDIFSLRELPERLIVLGGGAIGVEMAQAFGRLGSKVTIVERMDRLLPVEDPDIANELKGILMKDGIDVLTSTTAESVERNGDEITVHCDQGRTIKAEQLLVAVGRVPNIEDLNLAAVEVNTEKGRVIVDRRLRTTQKHIYACGDVCGPYPFTHMAEYQAGIVLSNAVFRFPKKTDYRVVPWVTYTDPELARVGQTEAQVREQGITPDVLTFPFNELDRALTEVETGGMVKLVVHKGRILGASILGPHAGELIHKLVFVMKMKAKIGDISATIHAYPTLAQVNKRTVNTYFGEKLFSQRTRTVVKWINRLLP